MGGNGAAKHLWCGGIRIILLTDYYYWFYIYIENNTSTSVYICVCVCTNKTKQYYYYYGSIPTSRGRHSHKHTKFYLSTNITQTFIYYIIIVIILKFTLCYFLSKQNNNDHVLDLCTYLHIVCWCAVGKSKYVPWISN